jgi:hypothetical protein
MIQAFYFVVWGYDAGIRKRLQLLPEASGKRIENASEFYPKNEI